MMGERFGFTFPLSLPLPDASNVTSTLYCGEAFQFLDVRRTGQNRIFCQVTPTEHEAKSVLTTLLKESRNSSREFNAQPGLGSAILQGSTFGTLLTQEAPCGICVIRQRQSLKPA